MNCGEKLQTMKNKKTLTSEQQDALLKTLKKRFKKNMHRHKSLEWENIEKKLKAGKDKLWSLNEMEQTGGEPDVIEYDKKTNSYFFYDCTAESPKSRRSTCYDREAPESRKEHKPENNAIDMAAGMASEL